MATSKRIAVKQATVLGAKLKLINYGCNERLKVDNSSWVVLVHCGLTDEGLLGVVRVGSVP